MTYNMDHTDAKIIKLLQEDGRMPNTAIASRLSIAEATVRKRIDRLVREKVIRVRAWVDPLKIGYHLNVSIEIRVNPPDIENVAERLAAVPEIYFLGICLGAFDILATAILRSNEDMYEFLTKRLTKVPGITHTASTIVIRVVKREAPSPVFPESMSPHIRRRQRRLRSPKAARVSPHRVRTLAQKIRPPTARAGAEQPIVSVAVMKV